MLNSNYIPNQGDASQRLLFKIAISLSALVDALAIPSSSVGTETFATGEDISVAIAGTAQQGPNVACPKGCHVTAAATNTGSVYLGDENVTNASGNRRGMELTQAGMTSIKMTVSNLNQLYINADNANDKVGVIIL